MQELRPYQKTFISDIRQAYLAGVKAPLAQGPTGMGKTVVLSNITKGAALRNNRTCILVHRQELVLQTSMALAVAGVTHSICAAGNVVKAAQAAQVNILKQSFYEYQSNTIVASVQSLSRRMHHYPEFDFIIIDEAQHSVAGSWRKVLDVYPNARLLGFTATPERLDGKGLGIECGGFFDALIQGPSVKDLITQGYLSQYKVYAPPLGFTVDGVKTIGGDYAKNEIDVRINRPAITGNIIEHYRRYCDKVPAIAFCTTVDHARNVAATFCEAGYKAACIDGKLDDLTRQSLIQSLGNGHLHLLTSCEIVSEGTDIPIVGALLLLRPTLSLALHLQQIGRGLRPYHGKECTIILDHVGNVARHGFPDDDRIWTLAGRRKGNGRKKDLADIVPPVRQCLQCYAIYPNTIDVCPQCGAEVQKSRREIEQIEGQLVEMQRIQARQEFKAEQGQAQSLNDLVELGKRRGYSEPHAWARHVYYGRQQRVA